MSTNEIAAAMEVAKGYAADPDMWNPPEPEQMRQLLALLAEAPAMVEALRTIANFCTNPDMPDPAAWAPELSHIIGPILARIDGAAPTGEREG